ncbi:porin [Bradyrhizobium sp. 49]|uniref:porin n=1 Tax=unclassified Bradyrhizobium TaxID=2631580 RepID=UPI001FF8B8E3|nr:MULTISPECIES: porin [unclassified Bradyrhizobium]MCK1268921.1 porin [Bradyrhizobium sp. 84]MCK1369481.1 porin [Bradyrhizobium sp. 49]
MKASILSLAALVGFTVSTQAADLSDNLKAPPPPPPDALTWKGITLFGQIDIGYGYNSQGTPLGGYPFGLNSNVLASPAGTRPISSLNIGGLGFNFIGLKLEEPIVADWKVIGQLDTGFNPLTGRLDDACATIIQNNGKPGTQQGIFANSARCGQAFNGQVFAGVRNPTYGTLTIGRQSPLGMTIMPGYDPTATSAFSQIGWASGWGGAAGVADANKWNSSVKYANGYGPIHGAVMYAQGGQDGGLHGNSYAGNIGATWNGFYVDAVYAVLRDAVSTFGYGVGGCGVTGTPSCNTLGGTAQNTEAWSLMGRYTFDVPGAFKGAVPGGKLTFYTGYQHEDFSNPSNPVSVGATVNGGYVIGLISNTSYTYGDKIRNIGWIGAKYETGPWTMTAAWYYGQQDFYKGSSPTLMPCSDTSSSRCAGHWQTASTTVDYAFNKYFDVYAGVMWSELRGGLAVGFTTATAGYPTSPQTTSFVTGMRFTF